MGLMKTMSSDENFSILLICNFDKITQNFKFHQRKLSKEDIETLKHNFVNRTSEVIGSFEKNDTIRIHSFLTSSPFVLTHFKPIIL